MGRRNRVAVVNVQYIEDRMGRREDTERTDNRTLTHGFPGLPSPL